jgi:hypothetical protein
MKKVNIVCSRCKSTITGFIEEGCGTSGFYDVSKKGGWHKFAKNKKEKYVCDQCMHNDPEYQKTYAADSMNWSINKERK